jgi:hypothetical protein
MMQPRDPFTDGKELADETRKPTFRDYFPYERSKDGNRARIGWTQSVGMFDSTAIGFDIEVRKIDGSWYPVEFRRVTISGRRSHQEAVIPLVVERK